jgi:hypothetical protein
MGAGLESDVFVFHFRARFPVRADGEVPHVSGMVPSRIVKAVLLALRIEMCTRRFEIWGIASRNLMKVDGVFAGWQIMQIELKFDM